MNKEAIPFILALLIPMLIVAVIFLYLYGYDITIYLKKIDLIYYIILFPFILGLIAALYKLAKTT
jgi:hypothetical protein